MTGAELRAARERAQLSMNELARRSGVGISAISRLESGHQRRLHPRTQRALQAALGMAAEQPADVHELVRLYLAADAEVRALLLAMARTYARVGGGVSPHSMTRGDKAA